MPPTNFQQIEQRIKFLENRLSKFDYSDRFIFTRDIEPNPGTGTRFGTDTKQKLAFYGAPPVDQPDMVADPGNVSATYSQAEVQEIVDRVADIIDRLQELGLIA